jgi:hypothetical protein
VRKAADYFVWGLPESLVVENDILNANSGAHEIGAGLIITVLSNFNIYCGCNTSLAAVYLGSASKSKGGHQLIGPISSYVTP